MSDVELSGLTKRYGETLAVADVSLRVEEGEFFSLLGPSGCGKTTTLRMIAGFVRPNEGRVFIGGEDMTLLPPERRGIGIVFQNYAIFPHMTVFDNIAFGLRMRKVPKREIRGRVGKALEQVNLDGYERRYQRELSGGEQQRVALARVLITEPKILLLDEPLSALDKKLREEMKYWIKELQQSLGITTVYVTHDQGEALTMSDRIAVMNQRARGADRRAGHDLRASGRSLRHRLHRRIEHPRGAGRRPWTPMPVASRWAASSSPPPGATGSRPASRSASWCGRSAC